jgi:mRNA interferase RelE/StbE
MYQPYFTKRFEKQIKKFPKKEQLKILDKISSILSDPRKPAIKLESTNPPVYRLRVGDYRVFFELDDEYKSMAITDTLRRTTQTYR